MVTHLYNNEASSMYTILLLQLEVKVLSMCSLWLACCFFINSAIALCKLKPDTLKHPSKRARIFNNYVNMSMLCMVSCSYCCRLLLHFVLI